MSVVLAPEKPFTGKTPASLQPVRQKRPRLPLRVVLGGGFTVLVLALCEVLVRTGVLPAASFPPPSLVFLKFLGLLAKASFWSALWDTMSVTLLGILVIVAAATPLALLIGFSRNARESSWFILEFLKPIPPVALIPLGLILWGPSPSMKLLLICFGAIWPLLTQLIYGVREVGGTALDMSRSYRLGWFRTTTHVVVPSVLPFAVTGLRVTASIALVISVVVEMIGGAPGLGQNITVAQTGNAMPTMYALIFTAGLLGLLINGAFDALQKRLLFWHSSQRKETP